MYNLKFLFMAFLALSLFNACSDDDDGTAPAEDPTPERTGTFTFKFDHGWGPGHEEFDIGMEKIHPLTQEEITFSTLRYYVSNIKLYNTDGDVWEEPESYRIVDAADHDNGEVIFTVDEVPEGSYSSLSFILGVDSARNTSGAQEGALDPAENMFWSWTTGYIFIKAEGESPAAPNGSFSYHIGGFQGEHNAIREIDMDFRGADLLVNPDAAPSAHINVNAARFWHGRISLEDVHTIHMPGQNAVNIANNMAGAFRLDHVHR